MEISNFTKYFVYWKISLVMLLENIITSDVIGKYIMGRLTNIGKYSSWSLILEASLHKIYCLLSYSFWKMGWKNRDVFKGSSSLAMGI